MKVNLSSVLKGIGKVAKVLAVVSKSGLEILALCKG